MRLTAPPRYLNVAEWMATWEFPSETWVATRADYARARIGSYLTVDMPSDVSQLWLFDRLRTAEGSPPGGIEGRAQRRRTRAIPTPRATAPRCPSASTSATRSRSPPPSWPRLLDAPRSARPLWYRLVHTLPPMADDPHPGPPRHWASTASIAVA